jgi:hypothetical protein
MTARSMSAIANREKTPPESKRVLAGFLSQRRRGKRAVGIILTHAGK